MFYGFTPKCFVPSPILSVYLFPCFIRLPIYPIACVTLFSCFTLLLYFNQFYLKPLTGSSHLLFYAFTSFTLYPFIQLPVLPVNSLNAGPTLLLYLFYLFSCFTFLPALPNYLFDPFTHLTGPQLVREVGGR